MSDYKKSGAAMKWMNRIYLIIVLGGALALAAINLNEAFAAEPAYLIDKEKVPEGWMCYYSNGWVIGPVVKCQRYLR